MRRPLTQNVNGNLTDDPNKAQLLEEGREHANALLRYMKRTASRAPRGAISGVKYLYRVLDDQYCQELQDADYLTDSGFMAFTFRKLRDSARITVASVPKGTPWIWYGHSHNPAADNESEDEVLLPPGTLQVIGLAPGDEPLPPNSVCARYAPADRW